MRYQYPAPNPLAHYWEEELSLVWGIRVRFQYRIERFFSYLFGELILANAFLLFELVSSIPVVVTLRKAITLSIARVRPSVVTKRAIDILGASIGIVLALPLWICVPLLIKLDSKGPVFYLQERVGRNRRRRDRRTVALNGLERRSSADRRTTVGYGRFFKIIKFRSMAQDAEKLTGPVWAVKNDPRVTRVGRILRATRVDELPQLLNVLVGDMSLVGPRPERPYFVHALNGKIKDYSARFNARPGITGLAQVEHKYDESLADVFTKTDYDLNYISNWNVLQDVKIILKTVVVVATARGM